MQLAWRKGMTLNNDAPIFRHQKFAPYRRALELHVRAAEWIPERTQNHGLLMHATVKVALALADSVYEKEDRRALHHLDRAEKLLQRAMAIIETQAYRLHRAHVEEAVHRITELLLALRELEHKPRSTWLDQDPMPPQDVVSRESSKNCALLLEIVAEIVALKQQVTPQDESHGTERRRHSRTS